MAGKRVCVIGSGPSGMAFLYHIEKLRLEGSAVPEVVCYDKQSDWGGLWNYDWRTGMTTSPPTRFPIYLLIIFYP